MTAAELPPISIEPQSTSSMILDCRNMNCPMPIVELSKAARVLERDDILEVLATDLAFKLDLEAWLRRTGHECISFENAECQRARIRIAKGAS